MAEFTATGRVPCVPLSYENKDLARPKELIVDYKIGNVYIKKEDGTLVDISASIKETILDHIQNDPEFSNNITITIDGDEYTLQTIIADHAAYIEQILKALGYYIDEETSEVRFDLLDKIAKIDPGTGEIEFVITSDDIVETEDKQFVSAEEKDKIAKSTHPEIIQATVLGGESAWTGSSAPYTQQIDVAGVKESDAPVVDICLSDDYETVQKQLDSYGNIFKILTFDNYIIVYASDPTEDDIVLQMKIDR